MVSDSVVSDKPPLISIFSTAVPIEIPQKILDYIYSCNLSRIVNLIQPGITANENYSGNV